MRWNRLFRTCWLFVLLLVFGAGLGKTEEGAPDTPVSETSASPEETAPLAVKHLLTLVGFASDHPFRMPMGLFYDAEHDELYVADTANDDVDVFTGAGEPRFRILSETDLVGPFDLAGCSRQIYVSQMERRGIVAFDFRGTTTQTFAAPGTGPSRPGRMALGPDEMLYVADRAGGTILVFDDEGNLQRRIGQKGDADGQFWLIAGVAVDDAGRVYATDSKRKRIQVFDADGSFLRSVGDSQPGPLAFSFLGGIAVDAKHRVWVTDSFRHQVKVFDENWKLLLQFGGYGMDEERFFFPVDLALDEEGHRVYVLEKGTSRVQIFRIEEEPGDE